MNTRRSLSRPRNYICTHRAGPGPAGIRVASCTDSRFSLPVFCSMMPLQRLLGVVLCLPLCSPFSLPNSNKGTVAPKQTDHVQDRSKFLRSTLYSATASGLDRVWTAPGPMLIVSGLATPHSSHAGMSKNPRDELYHLMSALTKLGVTELS